MRERWRIAILVVMPIFVSCQHVSRPVGEMHGPLVTAIGVTSTALESGGCEQFDRNQVVCARTVGDTVWGYDLDRSGRLRIRYRQWYVPAEKVEQELGVVLQHLSDLYGPPATCEPRLGRSYWRMGAYFVALEVSYSHRGLPGRVMVSEFLPEATQSFPGIDDCVWDPASGLPDLSPPSHARGDSPVMAPSNELARPESVSISHSLGMRQGRILISRLFMTFDGSGYTVDCPASGVFSVGTEQGSSVLPLLVGEVTVCYAMLLRELTYDPSIDRLVMSWNDDRTHARRIGWLQLSGGEHRSNHRIWRSAPEKLVARGGRSIGVIRGSDRGGGTLVLLNLESGDVDTLYEVSEEKVITAVDLSFDGSFVALALSRRKGGVDDTTLVLRIADRTVLGTLPGTEPVWLGEEHKFAVAQYEDPYRRLVGIQLLQLDLEVLRQYPSPARAMFQVQPGARVEPSGKWHWRNETEALIPVQRGRSTMVWFWKAEEDRIEPMVRNIAQ
jgi:hypothetical protein